MTKLPRYAAMLAAPGVLPSDDDRGAYEVKFDGIRAIGYVAERLRLLSRNGNDITAAWPEIAPESPGSGLLLRVPDRRHPAESHAADRNSTADVDRHRGAKRWASDAGGSATFKGHRRYRAHGGTPLAHGVWSSKAVRPIELHGFIAEALGQYGGNVIVLVWRDW
ncbi:hypothetical protein [Nocardia sp. CA-120079]|uniref:hypothetical protein n=1 Tax=Nocardia sp. CA-120079 TaxID=3239974 RepID=UPI003D98F8EC